MCIQNSDHDKTVLEPYVKSKTMTTDNFQCNKPLFMAVIVAK